jgi:hydroxymethylpyrimidine pyrophosphatase-like HAD family hydrolase
MKTIIFASDIDKTLTDERQIIPDEVANYLALRSKDGWKIVLLTGRTFCFAMMSLEKLNFDYYLGVQNGAEVLMMPSKTPFFRNFLSKQKILEIDSVYQSYSEDFLVYSGLEKGDFCYYRKSKFSDDKIEYLEKLKKLSASDWIEVLDMHELPDVGFPLVKGIAKRIILEKIFLKLKTLTGISMSLIQDTVDPNYAILLITKKGVDKGSSLEKISSTFAGEILTIGAGDDLNDFELLKKADIKIAMSTSPIDLLDLATIVARPATELGIIEALEEARKRIS